MNAVAQGVAHHLRRAGWSVTVETCGSTADGVYLTVSDGGWVLGQDDDGGWWLTEHTTEGTCVATHSLDHVRTASGMAFAAHREMSR